MRVFLLLVGVIKSEFITGDNDNDGTGKLIVSLILQLDSKLKIKFST